MPDVATCTRRISMEERMKKKVLLVDDAKTVLLAEQMMLTGQGFELLTAQNGAEALEMISKHSPDLILLDIIMPEMNGIECCRRVKSNPSTKGIPIIMVTTKGEPEKLEASLSAGCDDYLTKPINKMQLLTKIKNHMSQ